MTTMNKNKGISLFTVSFKQGFISPKIPIATFHQGDKELVLLLDTGSDKNVIDANALEQFTHRMHEDDEDPTTHLSGVGGTQKVSVCTLEFKCGDETYTEDFLVTDLKQAFDLIRKNHCITLHGILGSDFLRKNNVVLDFKNLAAYNK